MAQDSATDHGDEKPSPNKPRVSKEVQLASLEVFIGGLLAWMIHGQLGDASIADAAGMIVGAFAALHGLHRIITVFETTKSIGELEGAVDNLRETVDERLIDTEDHLSARLSELGHRVGLGELSELYWSIDREFDVDKNAVLGDAREKLFQLLSSKTSSPMYKAIYYTWITENIARVGRGGKIIAVSRMKSTEWENSPEEKNFFAQNRAAAEAGAIVERIFVTTREVFQEATKENPPENTEDINAARVLKAHSSQEKNNMHGWFADETRLQKEDPDLLERIGDGFLMFRYGKSGDRVALIDDFTEDDEARGRATKHATTLSRMEQSFDNLKSMSEPF